MPSLDYYPLPSDLIENELNVLDLLRNNPYINTEHSIFARDAHQYYNIYKNSRCGFEFNSFFDICHTAILKKKNKRTVREKQRPNIKLFIAVKIELTKNNSYQNVSYCLAIGKIRADHPSILRKFHFDIDTDSNRTQLRLQQHPQSHFQYCGEMVPSMARVGFRQSQLEQMHPWLSEPRILYWPMSLALLVDMALHEFPDDNSLKFRACNEWRGIIRRNETLFLQPFFEKCTRIITQTNGENRILADEFYVQ